MIPTPKIVYSNFERDDYSLEQQIATFLKQHDISATSKETYKRQLKQFKQWLEQTGGNPQLELLRREDILAFKEYLQNNKSPYTVNAYLTAVRRLFEWGETENICPDITRGIKGIKKPKGHRRDALNPQQVQEALAAISQDTLTGLRDYALFNLMVRTALRTVEVTRATVGDLRQEAGEAVLWIQGKGSSSKDDFVLLTEDSQKPINKYLTERGDSLPEEAPLFASHSDRNLGKPLTTRSVSRIVKGALRKVELNSNRLTAHSLRHTAITLAIRGGASLHQAQAMARHSDPKSTSIYFHNLSRISDGAEKYIAL